MFDWRTSLISLSQSSASLLMSLPQNNEGDKILILEIEGKARGGGVVCTTQHAGQIIAFFISFPMR